MSYVAVRNAGSCLLRTAILRTSGCGINVQQTREKSRARKLELKNQKRAERLAKGPFIPRDVLERQKLSGSITVEEKEQLLAKKAWTSMGPNIFTEPPVAYFHDIMRFLRETNSPDIGNNMDGMVQLELSLDMRSDKQGKFRANFALTVIPPHNFVSDKPNQVLAFCETTEQQAIAIEAGANHAGGNEVISALERGEISSFEYTHCVCTPEMYPSVLKIRKILKDKMPAAKEGQIGADIKELVTHFRMGKTFTTNTDFGPEVGYARVKLGPLNMSDSELRENMIAYLEALEKKKGYKKDMGAYIFKAKITVLGCQEKFFLHVPTAKLTPEQIIDYEIEEAAKQETTVDHTSEEDQSSLTLKADVEEEPKYYLSEEERLEAEKQQQEKELAKLLKEEKALMRMGDKQYQNYRQQKRAELAEKKRKEKEFNDQLTKIYRQKRLERLSKEAQMNVDLERQYRLPLHI